MTDCSAFELVKNTRPSWFIVAVDREPCLIGTAVIPISAGSADFAVRLAITSVGGGVGVGEPAPALLPAACSDRHINRDGSFCLGYGFDRVTSEDEARVWWAVLSAFLRLQRTANRTKRWPAGHAIAHGAAGIHHMTARDAASRLGVLLRYDEMVAAGGEWLTVAQTGLALEYQDDPYVAILLEEDKLRVVKERQHYEILFQHGAECCGTLDFCPLRNLIDGQVPHPN